MRLRQGGVRRSLRTGSVVLAVLLASAGLTVTHTGLAPAPTLAHARIAGTSPENHAHIDRLPDRVTIYLTTKPVTVDGDPLRVYGPTGERVDAGDVRLVEGRSADDPAALSVGLTPAAEETGDYHVVYRVVSRDTHLVAGRTMFHYGEADPAVLPVGVSPGRSENLRPGWSGDWGHWPKVLAGTGVALGLAGLALQRRRRARREATVGARTLAAGLVAGRRLD
jgi:copper transport protein